MKRIELTCCSLLSLNFLNLLSELFGFRKMPELYKVQMEQRTKIKKLFLKDE